MLCIPQWGLVPQSTKCRFPPRHSQASLLGEAAPSEGHRQQVQPSEHSHLDLPLYFLSPFEALLGRSVKETALDEHNKENAGFTKDAHARRASLHHAHLGSLEEFEEKRCQLFRVSENQ